MFETPALEPEPETYEFPSNRKYLANHEAEGAEDHHANGIRLSDGQDVGRIAS